MKVLDVPTPEDLETLSRQLGRPVRDVVSIGARCAGCAAPLVAVTAPRLSHGIPFPTTFYLTHPLATAAISRLEAAGVMATMTERIADEPQLAAAHQRAHEHYLQARKQIGEAAGTGPVPEIDGISAGGMPTRVKCLHVLAAHSLAAGPGVNVLGDETLAAVTEEFDQKTCRCHGAWDTANQVPTKDLSRHVRRLEKAGTTNPIRHQRSSPQDGSPVAAIDCGTNSIRLLIALPVTQHSSEVQLKVLHRDMKVVRLGQGVDATGQFSPQALQRTLDATEEYAQIIAQHGVEAVRFIATSASRDVSNRDEFVAGIRQRLAVTPEVVSGTEEAELTFTGALGALSCEQLPAQGRAQVLVVDLGGGSTECVLGEITVDEGIRNVSLKHSISVDVGCVRFTERHLKSDPPTSAEIEAASTELRAVLSTIDEAIPLENVDVVIGVAGTITTITAAALELENYDAEAIHATRLPLETVYAQCDALLEASKDQRMDLGFMHPGRADVIGAGALIWSSLLKHIHHKTSGRITSATTSEYDILDGIAWSLINTTRPEMQASAPKQQSCTSTRSGGSEEQNTENAQTIREGTTDESSRDE